MHLDKAIRSVVQATRSPLLSIPGIGPPLAAMILAEIGDIHRFSSPDKLQAFAGLQPSIYQSGKFKADHNTAHDQTRFHLFALGALPGRSFGFD